MSLVRALLRKNRNIMLDEAKAIWSYIVTGSFRIYTVHNHGGFPAGQEGLFQAHGQKRKEERVHTL